ncbi:MAG: hypothetical protein QNJ12_01575 [Ilumatobacter sp.]|uniref:hypothetical protein n=1 Tax=Ilumatobacter sp. TaxID=1967498 RepID=UPI002630D256|nr:hypothetical protein [Ilumatobacter sp.]MDJ0767444.1 hypothetical protein [Ilumatobacter sp.]
MNDDEHIVPRKRAVDTALGADADLDESEGSHRGERDPGPSDAGPDDHTADRPGAAPPDRLEADQQIVVPSAEVLAVVRHADPPAHPPADLVPFVAPVVDAIGEPDWYLTEDALGFAEPHIPLAFSRWRAEWERTWTLDPLSSLEGLYATSVDLDVPLLQLDIPSGRCLIGPSDQRDLPRSMEAVREAVRERGHHGYGFVDATPDREAVGLARTWSGALGPELLAADRSLRLTMVPSTGLSATRLIGTEHTVEGVEEYELTADEATLRGRTETLRLDVESARVLGWLIPGAARWRVRRIPEVVVWARTFDGLAECSAYASALGLDILVTTRRALGHAADTT